MSEDQSNRRQNSFSSVGLSHTRNSEKKCLKITYPGAPGSFSHLAAKDYFDSSNGVKFVPSPGFQNVFSRVESGEVQFGILPLCNSRSGVLTNTLDLLIQSKCFIIGESPRNETHFLCALPGVKITNIKKVYSHPHLLAQCEKFLTSLSKKNNGVERVCTRGSAEALKILKTEQNKFGAAIASKEGAEHMGMNILEKKIADLYPIVTRYIIVSREPKIFFDTRDLKLKSSLCVHLLNQTGGLFKVLSCFALRGLVVDSIHSRPASTVPPEQIQSLKQWDLIFYIDYIPSQDEDENKALLQNVREYSAFVRELGTFEENNPNIDVEGWYNTETKNYNDSVFY